VYIFVPNYINKKMIS